MSKSAIDKDLKRVQQLHKATQDNSRAMAAPGIALVFLLAALVWASFAVSSGPLSYLVIIATVIALVLPLVGTTAIPSRSSPQSESQRRTALLLSPARRSWRNPPIIARGKERANARSVFCIASSWA